MQCAGLYFEKSIIENRLGAARTSLYQLRQKRSGLTVSRGTSPLFLSRLALLMRGIADEKHEEIHLMMRIETVLQKISKRQDNQKRQALAQGRIRRQEEAPPAPKRRRDAAFALLTALLLLRAFKPRPA